MRKHLPAAVVVVALSHSVAQAQSLGDIAKQEEARRKAVSQAGKVYTNETLRSDGAQPVQATPPPAASADKPAQAATPGQDAKPAAEDPKKDEKYWRQRLSDERDKLSRAQTFADALQSRINGLTADFAARDDPFQRNQISNDRQKALAELDRVRKEIDAATKAIADIQEEGRKAGVPAGWLR